jgi:hypothetical protein
MIRRDFRTLRLLGAQAWLRRSGETLGARRREWRLMLWHATFVYGVLMQAFGDGMVLVLRSSELRLPEESVRDTGVCELCRSLGCVNAEMGEDDYLGVHGV